MGRRSVTRSQVVILGGHALRMLLALGLTKMLGTRLAAEDFGFFALISTTFTVSLMLLDLGSGSLAVREVAKDPARETPLLEGLMAWRFLAGGVLSLGLVLWGALQDDAQRRWVFWIAAASMNLMAPGALSPVFVVRQRLEAPVVARTLNHAIMFLLAWIFCGKEVPGAYFGLLVVLRELMNMGALLVLARRLLGTPLRPGFRGRAFLPFLKMAAILALATLLQQAYFHVDVFLVERFRGEAELGAYASGQRLVNALLVVPGIFLIPLLPLLSSAAARDRRRFALLLRGSNEFLCGVGVLGAVLGCVVAEDLLAALYEGRYLSAPLHAVASLRWLTLAFGAVFCASTSMHGLLAQGRERLLVAFGLAGLLVNVAGNAVLLCFFDFTAAAFMTAVTEWGVTAAAFVFLARSAGREVLSRGMLLALLPAAGAGALLWALPGSPPARVALALVLGVAALAVLWVLPGTRRFRGLLAAEKPGELGAPPA